ncbi:MAG: four helix bundle protein [Armatimonadota bacterium]
MPTREDESGSWAGAPRAHRNLRVWQAGLELAEVVYALTAAFPSDERYGLAGQMRRAAVSVPSNIAEGAARASNAEFLRFLHAARGSLAELDTQMEIAHRRGYLKEDEVRRVAPLMQEVGRTLQGLIARRKRIAAEQEATGRK